LDADWSVELGADDPALEFPWSDPDGKLRYVDLREHPDHIGMLKETAREPELADALRLLNSSESVFATAKCDLWLDEDPVESERVYGAVKFASYVDCVLADPETTTRSNFGWHESVVKLAVEVAAGEDVDGIIEYVVRRCFFHPPHRKSNEDYFLTPGLCVTMYASGFGENAATARAQWAEALQLASEALVHAGRNV
jgi:hypothetical protein